MENINLPTYAGWVQVPISEIVRLEGLRNYTVFVLSNGQRLTYSKTISTFEDYLPLPFVRTHKSCIINLRYLAGRWQRGEKGVLMNDGFMVCVSRRRMRQVREWIKNYT